MCNCEVFVKWTAFLLPSEKDAFAAYFCRSNSMFVNKVGLMIILLLLTLKLEV